jgi:hypothetical protein
VQIAGPPTGCPGCRMSTAVDLSPPARLGRYAGSAMLVVSGLGADAETAWAVGPAASEASGNGVMGAREQSKRCRSGPCATRTDLSNPVNAWRLQGTQLCLIMPSGSAVKPSRRVADLVGSKPTLPRAWGLLSVVTAR